MVIQDVDYVLYKKLAIYISNACENALKKLNAKCLPMILKYEKVKGMFISSGNYALVGENSKKLQDLRSRIIKILAIQDRIEKILIRNKQRVDFCDKKLESMGIYNQSVDKKEFSKSISVDLKMITDTALNLNCYDDDGVIYKFFEGEVFAFENGSLDFSLNFNNEKLSGLSPETLKAIVTTFPSSVATIPEENYLDGNIKNNILKECVLYASENLKNQSFSKSNKDFGGLLTNVGKINTVAEFAVELKNYFNVTAKQCIEKNAPGLIDEIDGKLRCNEASELLPASKRRMALANGLAGDVPKTEAEESEEIRKAQEQETKKSLTNEELLELMLADEDDLEIENDEQSIALREAEEKRLIEEKQREEEAEIELQNALKKNDSVD